MKKIEILNQSNQNNIPNDGNKIENEEKKSMDKKKTAIRKSAPTIILKISLKLAHFW